MEMTFRWYGHDDPVTLKKIRQIPGVTGIVTAIYDIPVGEVWGIERIRKLVEDVNQAGLSMTTIESVPVHEDIKIGAPSRDELIDHYCQTIRKARYQSVQRKAMRSGKTQQHRNRHS